MRACVAAWKVNDGCGYVKLVIGWKVSDRRRMRGSARYVEERCPICAGMNSKEVQKYRGVSPLFEDRLLRRCSDCALVYTSPMPSEQEIREYNEGYFKNAHSALELTIEQEVFFRAMAGKRVRFMEKSLRKSLDECKEVLEIGSGHGFLAEEILTKFEDINYFAIESDSSCHKELVRRGVTLERTFSDKKYDIIILSHILEHVENPIEFLGLTTESLKDDGELFIDVPCQDWRYKEVDEPHLLFFNKMSLEYLISKSGLEIERISYCGQQIDQSPFSLVTGLVIRGVTKLLLESYKFIGPNRLNGKRALGWIGEVMMLQTRAGRYSESECHWIRIIARKNTHSVQ